MMAIKDVNSFGYLFTSMCPAPVRKATNTGAVSKGNGDAGIGGNRSMNRSSQVSAPACPPSRVWFDGREDMMFAMMEISPYSPTNEDSIAQMSKTKMAMNIQKSSV
jgi:hypothetical protein